jgi:RecA-family ATPase
MSLADIAKSYSNGGFSSVRSAEKIIDTEYNKQSHIISGVIPQGVTLLVSSPKMGKSFLCLGLALAVASGGKVLGVEV